ncbi:P-loop containing nucleoside triphosphate hydrolase protein [Baffinella frigidus]|nr:P-loop containing nucleoside triphosphate hydrolase protein [Cryptophyta sp. CCMP2293]
MTCIESSNEEEEEEEGEAEVNSGAGNTPAAGKTFLSITMLWTLLRTGMLGKPTITRAAVICPTSLVKNWANEITKWLGDRLEGGVIALCNCSREDVIEGINKFCMRGVMIISYETFRIHAERFQKQDGPELIICDEAHRLKNGKTITNQALASLPCRRRVLLSGTPMQNDLEEFYAMVDFTNPGALGDEKYFRRYFQSPILHGREPDASDAEREKGNAAQGALSNLVNCFLLRRTNELLSQHLPPKIVQNVCCKATPLQVEIYKAVCVMKDVARTCKSRRTFCLELPPLSTRGCPSPPLLLYTLWSNVHGRCVWPCFWLRPFRSSSAVGVYGLNEITLGFAGANQESFSALSGKMALLERMLYILYHEKKERIVLISNYTQTLELFQAWPFPPSFLVMCRNNNYPFVRLDGGTSVKKRQTLVDDFNDPMKKQFAFLLSSKAGGCGLNLIGASRLVLFDPDWNPANDKQAAARVWRDGQKRRVFEYRSAHPTRQSSSA